MRRPRPLTLTLAVAAAAAVSVPAAASAGYAPFDDGPFGVHEPGIDWAADRGVTAGCTPAEYCPNEAVTRAQMATFLQRLSGHADGVAPAVDAATVDGRTASQLEVVNGFAQVSHEERQVDAVVEVSASCPAGTRALGGGGTIDGLYATTMSGPTADGRGWQVVWVSDDHRRHEVVASVTATCAPTDGPTAVQGASVDRDAAVERLRRDVEVRRSAR